MSSVFNKAALCFSVEQIKKEPMPPLETQEFISASAESEVIIRFYHASKDHSRDAVHFWLTVVLHTAKYGDVVNAESFLTAMLSDKYTLCKEVSFEEFIKTIHHYDFVEGKQDYSLRGEFQQAWLVYDVGIELAIIAESDCEFIAFCWELYD